MCRRPILRAPSLAALWMLVACVACSAQSEPPQKLAPWVELKSAHFTVYSDGGQKSAEKLAFQFEQIRDVFTKLGKNIRVDPGQPIIILAAKDEKSIAALLPEFYSDKNRMHPAGIFMPGTERNFIVVRTNLDSDLPFATVYHEYTHQITNLSAAFVPTWLTEGYAEFFGYSQIIGRRVSIGLVPPGDLYFLQQQKLLPLEQLFRVDHRSPYYNEGKKANIFYAESWALVHMLFMSPEFRDKNLVGDYLRSVDKNRDPVETARAVFGDLNALQKKLEAYVRGTTYFHYELNSPIEEIAKSFSARTPSEAETAALLGTYHLSHEQLDQGRALLEQALKLDPDLVAANEALGIMHIHAREFAEAGPYIEWAVRNNSQSFLTYYFHGNLLMQSRDDDPSVVSTAESSFAKSVQLNPNFAPAHAALAQLYGRKEETLDKALQSARTAVALEPANWRNQLAMAVVLARRSQFPEAREIADRVAANASEPEESEAAASTLSFIASAQQYVEDKRRYEESRRQITNAPPSGGVDTTPRRPAAENATESPVPVLRRRTPAADSPRTVESSNTPSDPSDPSTPDTPAAPRAYSMLGKVSVVDCNSAPQVFLTLTLGGFTMKLHSADLAKVNFPASPGQRLTCTQLRGVSARVQYSLVSGESYEGEILAIAPTTLPALAPN